MDLYKTFWRRVAAMIIDAIVLAPITGLILVMTYRGMSFTTYVVLSLLSFIVTCSYWIGMQGRFGQTLGKMALGVKVVRMDDQPICYGIAAKRYLPFIVIGLIMTVGLLSSVSGSQITFQSMAAGPKWPNALNFIFLLAQLITVLSNPMRRAIHDFVAGTKVVVLRKAVPPVVG